MRRFLQGFNFIGVVALSVLCAAQWKANGELHERNVSLEGTARDQAATIAADQQAIGGYKADLDEFRQRLEMAESELKQTVVALHAAEDERDLLAVEKTRLTGDRDSLKTAVAQWQAAVAARDAAIKQANERTAKLAAERDLAVGKFNDLAGKYNGIVKELDEARGKGTATGPTK